MKEVDAKDTKSMMERIRPAPAVGESKVKVKTSAEVATAVEGRIPSLGEIENHPKWRGVVQLVSCDPWIGKVC